MASRSVSRRALLGWFGTGTAAFVLAACQPQVVEVEKIKEATVVVEKVVTAQPAPRSQKIVLAQIQTNRPHLLYAQDRLAEMYYDHHPEAYIVWEGAGGGPGMTYPTWLGAMLAAGDPYPDIVSGNYASAYGNFVDMAKHRMAINPYSGRPWNDDLDWNWIGRGAMGGRITVLKTRAVHCMWFWNKELFAKVGLNKPPDDWNEWVEISSELKAAGITPVIVNWSFQLPQWTTGAYYDLFCRNERYEYGRALEGDWCWDPDVDGTLKYDPNDPDHDLSYTFSGQRYLRNVLDGAKRYDTPEVETIVHEFTRMFPRYATDDMFVLHDYYPPFLQQQGAVMSAHTSSLAFLHNDFKVFSEARREALALGRDVRIDPFEFGTFENPPMISPLVDGPIRAVESSTTMWWSVIQKDQKQTDAAIDFVKFWLSPKGYQAWIDFQYKDPNHPYSPPGILMVKDVKEPPGYAELFKDVKMLGNSEIAYNVFNRWGTSGSTLYARCEDLFKDALQEKMSPAEYGKRLQANILDGWEEVLAAARMTPEDIANPERRPASL